jgi:hypothetical protein
MIFRYFIAWIPLVFIKILNGTIREYTYGAHIFELHAHQISTLTGIILSGFYVWHYPFCGHWPRISRLSLSV